MSASPSDAALVACCSWSPVAGALLCSLGQSAAPHRSLPTPTHSPSGHSSPATTRWYVSQNSKWKMLMTLQSLYNHLWESSEKTGLKLSLECSQTLWWHHCSKFLPQRRGRIGRRSCKGMSVVSLQPMMNTGVVNQEVQWQNTWNSDAHNG